MSAIVSVKAQKNGGLYVHPIGNVKGIATRKDGSCGISFGIKTAKAKAAVEDNGTL
jgi:hypothetical protein